MSLMTLRGASPTEFEPNGSLQLNATVLYASTNTRVGSDYSVKVEFLNFSSDGSISSIDNVTAVSGVALKTVSYSNNGKAHAYLARIVPDPQYQGDKFPQGIASNPVQLTVAKATRLLLEVTRDESSSNHVIHGWLKWGSSGVNGKQVKVKINETEYSLITNASGHFSLSLTLQPKDNLATVYMVTASFEDCSQPLNATAWAYTLDGQRFAACTTFQYGYKPASNTTSLTVDPQATQVMTPTKTPEEMQEEAEDSGWLTTWHEWSWWYPWYRFHMIYLLDGQQQFDVGVGLFGGSIITPFQQFLERLAEYLGDVATDIFVDYILGEMVALVGAMTGNIFVWLGTLAASVWIRTYLLLQSWDSIEKLRTSYVAQWISIMIEVGFFIHQLSWGSLVKIAQGLVTITSIAWNIITIIANVLIDIVVFISQIDIRLAQLGGR
jgi:hypothetical protein